MIELLMTSGTFVEPSLASGLVFRTTNEANMFKSIHQPTDAQAILNSWPRVSGQTYFSDPSTATGESADWTYDATLDSFVQPNNSSAVESILSPVKLESYVFETTLTSSGADDDLIGIVLAAEEINGSMNMLFAWVAPRGVGGYTFSVAFMDATATGAGTVINGNNILANYSNANTTNSNGWSGKDVMIRASRVGGIVTVKCSDWDGTSLLDTTEIEVNMNNLPRDGVQLATNPARYGFTTQSQANSTYLGYTIRSGEVEDDTKVYSENDNLRWVYQSGSWTQSGNAYDDFSSVDRVINRLTKESFDVNTSTLQFRTNNGISYGTVTLSLPASTATSVDFTTILSEYAYSESFTINGIFNETDLTASIGTTVVDVTTTTVSGSFYVLLETPETTDPNTNVTDQTIGFRKVNVNVT